MKRLVIKIIDKIKEIRQEEKEVKEMIERAEANIRARKAREQYYSQLVQQRLEYESAEFDKYMRNLLKQMLEEKMKRDMEAHSMNE